MMMEGNKGPSPNVRLCDCETVRLVRLKGGYRRDRCNYVFNFM